MRVNQHAIFITSAIHQHAIRQLHRQSVLIQRDLAQVLPRAEPDPDVGGEIRDDDVGEGVAASVAVTVEGVNHRTSQTVNQQLAVLGEENKKNKKKFFWGSWGMIVMI
jgi:hypothetical protein